VKGDLDYAGVASAVLRATDARKEMTALGLVAPASNTKTFVVMGKTFDPAKPEEYIASFPIKRT
jgi:nitrate/nitrite transport system substrate-binding protein